MFLSLSLSRWPPCVCGICMFAVFFSRCEGLYPATNKPVYKITEISTLTSTKPIGHWDTVCVRVSLCVCVCVCDFASVGT